VTYQTFEAMYTEMLGQWHGRFRAVIGESDRRAGGSIRPSVAGKTT